MRLGEEQGQEKLEKLLDVLELTEKNREIAEKYLSWDQPGFEGLLEQVERQDFSKLEKTDLSAEWEYRSYCQKRNYKEPYGRFVKFAAAVGGATAYYVVVRHGYSNVNSIREYLTTEQAVAMRAEGIAWNSFRVSGVLEGLEQKDPQVLKRAMDLCWHQYDNAKSLVAAAALYYRKPAAGFLQSVISAERERAEETKELTAFMEENLTSSLSNVFMDEPTEEDLSVMISFLKESSVNDPFPQEIVEILRKHQTSDYLKNLLAGEAFLSIEHSKLFEAFLRLAIAMDVEKKKTSVLDMCLKIGGQGWFFKHIEVLEDTMPMPKEDYVLWCLHHCKFGSPVKRVVKNEPDVVRRLISKVSTEDYQQLLAMTKNMNLMLYQELTANGYGDFRRKLAEELTECYKAGRQEAMHYLLGEAELQVLYPYVKVWRNTWGYHVKIFQKIRELKQNALEIQMYRRAVVLEGLCMRNGYFNFYYSGTYKKPGRGVIEEVVEVFEIEKLPVSYQLDCLSGLYDGFYQESDKNNFMDACVEILQKKESWKEEFPVLVKEGSALVRYLCVRVMDTQWQFYKDALLSCAEDSSKMVREILAAVYISHKEWEPEIEQMLGSKKSKEREMAALVLKHWGVTHYKEAFEAALAKEKSKKLKEFLEDCLGVSSISAEEKKERSEQDLIKAVLKGGRKRKIAWVYEKPLPEVHKLDGTLAAEDHLAAIMVCYVDMNTLGYNRDAVQLAESLDKKELAHFVNMVFSRWMEHGAQAKLRWVLYAASIHGGEEIIPVLHTQIQEWPKAARGAIAAEAVKALALNGSPTALLLVDQISRKFKFRQVKSAAGEALDYAAKELGISRAELEDRIVPSLGFDEKMERTFDYGTRTFKVILTAALELEVYDGNGKRLKNVPAPGKKDDPLKAKTANDAYKLLKKQLKTVVTNQKMRLDQTLSSERRWSVEKWKELFVKNPVMHQFAMGLVWGLYEDGALKETFRYMEDGSFNTVEEEEYTLPETGLIGLVHPIELDEESIAAWKEQLEDYEIIQPVEQLSRPLFRLTEEEKKSGELTRFGGKLLNGLSLSGKLQNMGWYRGSVQDAGGYYTFYREDGEIGVELEFSGCFVADENEEITVYGAQFYKAGTVARGSYVYDTIKEEDHYRLGEVSPRYVSEIILQLSKATASSTEQLEYPACKNRR